MLLKNKENILIFLFFIILAAYIFRSLIVNHNMGLIDWFDYPFIVWVISQNTNHLTTLNPYTVFETNAFFSYKETMLLSDLLWPQSVIAFLLTYFSKNPIEIFNSLFFIIITLNFLSAFILWRDFFENKLQLFFAILTTAFSPFFFLQLGHFQMINFWPFLFGLHFLFKEEFKLRYVIILSIFFSIQFLSSVYLSIFMLFSIIIWYLLKIACSFKDNKTYHLITIKQAAVFFVVSLLINGPIIYKYLEVKENLGIERSYGEFIDYAAYPLDYLFNYNYTSLISSTDVMLKWNSMNPHVNGESASSPGFALVILSLIGFWKFYKSKDRSIYSFYFLILGFTGLVFSFGPRLILSTSLWVPNVYYFFLKMLPPLEIIRVTMRWSFLFYLGVAYFATFGLSKFKNKKLALFLFATIFILEIIPKEKKVNTELYYPNIYSKIQQECALNKKVLLEYPVIENGDNSSIFTTISYETKILLASVHHKCFIVNGYSGYYPKGYKEYSDNLLLAIDSRRKEEFFDLINQRGINIIKINKKKLHKTRVIILHQWIHEQKIKDILFEDVQYLVAIIK